jgi:SAM-dependent methyltransferase
VTTLPPERQTFSIRYSHRARDMAESFGDNAERYDRTRPRYPQAMVDAIVAATSGVDVLDVGIGTGVSAEPFRTAGRQVLGVDPDDRMAEFARRRGFEVEVAKFEEWDPAGRAFDAVIAGQTWHWVDPVAGAAKAAEVLRPNGRFAAFWNIFGFPPEIADAFAAVYRRVLPDSPLSGRGLAGGLSAYSGLLTKTIDGLGEVGGFEEPEQWQFEWERSYTRDDWLDVVPTAGGYNLFPTGQLEELLDGFGEVIDAAGGGFLMSYTAAVVTAAKAPAS